MTARKKGKGGSGSGSRGGLPSYAIVLVAVAIAIGFFHNLGANPLTDRDEGAFSEATREMLESGNYVSTYLNGEPRYDKPILIYYLQAASVTVFGQNEWGFRFPSAVAAALWVLATWFFTRRWVDEGAGWVAGIIAATTLWIMALGRAAIADAVLNLFIVLACFEAFNYAQEQKRGQVWRFFLWTGLGFLTKGPIGVVIPAGVSFAYALFRWTPGLWFRALVSPVGWAIFLAINVPWYAAQYMAEGQAFVDGFFLRHNVSRFTDTMEGHGGSWFYYVPVLFLITLPWTGLLVRTLGRITDAFQEDLDLYLWTWFGLVFVLFSVSGTQLPHYIVPGITPLFILMARYRELFEWRVASLLPLAIVLAALAFFPELWPRVEPYVQDENAIAMISGRLDVFTAGYRIWLLLGLAALGGLAFFRGLRPWQSLLGGALVFSFVLVQAVVPVVGEFIQGPTKEAALLAKENEWDVVMYSVDMPSFAVYYDRITPLRAPEPGEVAFTRSTRLHELDDVEVLYEKGIVVLARKLPPGAGAVEGASPP